MYIYIYYYYIDISISTSDHIFIFIQYSADKLKMAAYRSQGLGSQLPARVKLRARSKVLNGPWLDILFPAGLPKSTTVKVMMRKS